MVLYNAGGGDCDERARDSVSTPIVEGGFIFGRMGYPIHGDGSKGFRAFKIPATTEGGGSRRR